MRHQTVGRCTLDRHSSSQAVLHFKTACVCLLRSVMRHLRPIAALKTSYNHTGEVPVVIAVKTGDLQIPRF